MGTGLDRLEVRKGWALRRPTTGSYVGRILCRAKPLGSMGEGGGPAEGSSEARQPRVSTNFLCSPSRTSRAKGGAPSRPRPTRTRPPAPPVPWHPPPAASPGGWGGRGGMGGLSETRAPHGRIRCPPLLRATGPPFRRERVGPCGACGRGVPEKTLFTEAVVREFSKRDLGE